MHAANGTTRGFIFFSFWAGGGWNFFNYLVPIMFPMMLASSQWVSIIFPKGVPNSTSLYLISFAQSFPLVTYIGEPKGRHLMELRSSILGRSHTSFPGWRADQNGPLEKKKKKELGQQTPLMNRRVSNLCLCIWNYHLLGSALIWKESMK